MKFVVNHIKRNHKDCIDIRRLIVNDQVNNLRGEFGDPDEDKEVNPNLNKVSSMTVKLMRRCILEGTEGTITAMMSHSPVCYDQLCLAHA